MQKPNNYDNTSTGNYIPISVGGHRAVIKKVEETTSKTGKPMIKVAIDFDQTDGQPAYFMQQYKEDTRADKKWPYQAVQYIVTEDQDGKCMKSFKRFISAVEDSNGSTVTWGPQFAAWFAGKKVGVVYGDEESEYNGEIKDRQRIRYFCEYTKALDQPVPDKKFLQQVGGMIPQPKSNDISFMDISSADSEEIPF